MWPSVYGFRSMATPEGTSKGFVPNKRVRKLQGVSKHVPNQALDHDAEMLYYPFGSGSRNSVPLAKKVHVIDHTSGDGAADKDITELMCDGSGADASSNLQPILKALRAAVTDGEHEGNFKCHFCSVIGFTDKTGNDDVTGEERDASLKCDVPTSTQVMFAPGD